MKRPIWRRMPNVGVALGGGGARGGIHIGVLQVLEESNIPISAIAGTSIGSLIGALYALSPRSKWVEHRIVQFIQSDSFKRARFHIMSEASEQRRPRWLSRIHSFIKKEFLFTMALSRPYLISQERFREILLAFFPEDLRIEDLHIPFAAVATDLESGEEVIIADGPVVDAVYASCTYPGVIEAVRLNGRLLVDGGVVSNVPVDALIHLGAEVCIAVNAERAVKEHIEELSGLEILFRADDLMGAELTKLKIQRADVVIQPSRGEAKWYEFHKSPEYIEIGRQAAEEKLPEIVKAIYSRRPLGRIIGRLRSSTAIP